MKKGLLILLGMFMMVSTAEANIGEKLKSEIRVSYRYNDAITFNERGVEFHVFLNGDFDFNNLRSNRGIRIERDFNGQIRRVGNVFINYDYRGNVKRIGNVFMRYNRGNLTNVGNLTIRYSRWGDPYFYGRVKHNNYFYDGYGANISINIGGICDYNDAYFYRPQFRTHYRQFKEDNDFFYYRARPNAKIGKRSKILKRRKTTSAYYKTHKLPKRRSYKDGIYNKDVKKKRTTRKSTTYRTPTKRTIEKRITPKKRVTKRKTTVKRTPIKRTLKKDAASKKRSSKRKVVRNSKR